MRYTLGLLVLLILVGAGCSAKQIDTPPNKLSLGSQSTGKKVDITKLSGGFYGISDPSNGTLQDFFKAASENAGFHIYYPIYTPDNTVVDTKFIWSKTSASVTLSHDPSDPTQPSVMITESPSANPNNLVQGRLGKLTAKENITINGRPGYYGIYDNSVAKFETIIFSTDDGVDIGIWSKQYQKNVLIQVAENLK